MDKQDYFVAIYSFIWIVLILIFGIFFVLGKCDKTAYIILSNASFLTVTSIIVFIKPVRKWVDEKIISKL